MARKPRGLRWPARLLTWMLRLLLRALARTRIFKVTVVNREVIPRQGRVIVACNHISIADPIYLWGALRRPAVAIAMAELWRIPGVNLIMWLLGHIPVERGNPVSGKRALDEMQWVAENEGLVFGYPAARCWPTPLPFKPGLVLVAIATGALLVPSYISGSDQVKPLRSRKVYRRYPVWLVFGEPINPADFTGEDRVDQMVAELERRVFALSTEWPAASHT